MMDTVKGDRPEGHRRWRRMLPVPVTIAYTVILLVVGTWLEVENDHTQARILFRLSTNLHNLLHGHLGTLVSSAFVTDEPVWLMVPLLACVLILAEIRLGSRALVAVFLVGHVGATLLVAAGLYIGIRAGWLDASVVRAQDVGVSYGTMALIGCFTALMPPQGRPWWVGAWLAVAALGVGVGHTFTNVGHFVALCFGLVMAGPVTARGWLEARRHRLWKKSELVLLAASCVAGVAFLLA